MRTRSPFPGMDPWLESYWSSVHHRLISDFAEQIRSRLPEGLFADIEVTVYVTQDDRNVGTAIPDAGVFRAADHRGTAGQTDFGVAVATPYRIKLSKEPVEVGHVVIRSLRKREPLVTAIEVLSPTNKIDHRGRKAYLLKREAYYRAGVNVIEIDLLRSGPDLIDVRFDELPPDQIAPYKAVVCRAVPLEETEAEYYAFPIRERLPVILIPLRPGDKDVPLDLQQAVDRAYQGGSYGIRIDYTEPPEPQLAREDAAWAAELVSRSE